MNSESVNVNVKKVILERLSCYATQIIDPGTVESFFDVRDDFVSGNLIATMRGYVWSNEVQNETCSLTVEYPDGPWQSFKERYFPAWATRRWPVRLASKTTTHTFICRATYPNFKHVAPVTSCIVYKIEPPSSFTLRSNEVDE